MISSDLFRLVSGCKQYELSNHLGNVLVTVSDRKSSRASSTTATLAEYYVPYVLTISDYYAFGSSIKERTVSFSATYRYGFNNQEQDVEMGEYYAFEYRIHDARLGRFLSVDPLASEYPWNSTYSFAENCPIRFIDYLGLEKGDPTRKNPQGVVQKNWGISQFCQVYGVEGATWVHQADKVAQKNLVSFPDYPKNGTIQEKKDYFLSKKYCIHPNQVLNLPDGIKVNHVWYASDWQSTGVYASAHYYECGLNDKTLGDAKIVYDQPLYIPGKSTADALKPKAAQCTMVTGLAAEREAEYNKVLEQEKRNLVILEKRKKEFGWPWWLEPDAFTGHSDPVLSGNSPFSKPDAGGMSLTYSNMGAGLSISALETTTGNHLFGTGTYAPPGISLIKSPVSISVDCYYRTEDAKSEISTEEYLKGLSYVYSWGIFTYSYVLDDKGRKVLEGYQYGLTGIGFGLSGTVPLNKK